MAATKNVIAVFTLSPDQKGIETHERLSRLENPRFTLSPDQKGIETTNCVEPKSSKVFTLSPDQKGIETIASPKVHGKR